jgi:hypothetical protein
LGGEGSEFAGCGGVRRRGVGPVGGALHPPGIIRSTFKGSPDVIKWFTAAVRSGSTSGRNPPRRCSGWAIATSEGDVEIAVGHGRRSGDARATMDEERADNLTSSALKRGGIRRCGQLKPELQWASSSSYGAIRAGVSGVGPRPRVNLSIPRVPPQGIIKLTANDHLMSSSDSSRGRGVDRPRPEILQDDVQDGRPQFLGVTSVIRLAVGSVRRPRHGGRRRPGRQTADIRERASSARNGPSPHRETPARLFVLARTAGPGFTGANPCPSD